MAKKPMSKGFFDATIISKKGTLFDNGGKSVQFRLENGDSFAFPEGHPANSRLKVGMVISGTFTEETHKFSEPKQNPSGGMFPGQKWVTMKNVCITKVSDGEVDALYAALPEETVVYVPQTGGSGSGSGTPDLPKP